jgi:hypothetical protein
MDVQLTRDGADGSFFGVVEAQDLRLNVRRCHHGRIPSDRVVAQQPGDNACGAEIPGGPEPNIAARTSDSARPMATAGPPKLLRRSRSSANRAPADHWSAGGVNVMRHFLAARSVATRPHRMGEPPRTAGLVAPPGQIYCASSCAPQARRLSLLAAGSMRSGTRRSSTTPASWCRLPIRSRAR